VVSIDLSGKNGIVFGVANERSIAWGIAQALSGAGARLALTYQGERLKDRVERLAETLENPLLLPCDATDDAQIEEVFGSLEREFGEVSFLIHSIAFANCEDLSGGFVEIGLGTSIEADADDGFFARAIASVIDLDHAWGATATRMCWRVSAKAMACSSSARATGALTSDEYG